MKRNFCGFREYHLIREIKSSRKKTIFWGSGRLWPYQKLRFYLSDVSYINMNVISTKLKFQLVIQSKKKMQSYEKFPD